ncbi:hypothetical protein JHK84_047905 [Glycine max]|nr:hypothetical protein JHK86_047884 [Glycine max]KAG4943847.1 hypothetical protein JHK85_048493 [Glycine max]KAG5102936.1 hypothetical protein JHK84_047905 [Glycine max]
MLVNDLMCKVLPIALKERNDCEELAITTLVSGNLEELNAHETVSEERERNSNDEKAVCDYGKKCSFQVQTALISDGVLPGTIRQLVLESEGIPFREVAPSWSECEIWEEAFITNLVEIIHKVVKLMDNLQSRGALREVLPNANSTGEDVIPDDNEHENHVEEVGNSQVGLEPMGATNSEHVNEDMLDGEDEWYRVFPGGLQSPYKIWPLFSPMVLPHFKHSRFKDDQHCSHRITEVLDPDGKISPTQIFNMLKRLGLAVAPRRKMCDADAEGPLSTSPNQLDGDKITGATNHKSVNLEGSLLVQHIFKDHRRCSYMIANALDKDGKFTTAQVSRKLKLLGLSLPLKSSGGKMHPKGADLMDRSNERMDESDDETLVSLVKRKKMESGKLSRGQLHGQTSEDKLSKGDSDDEMLSSVLKRTRRPSLKSKQVELENIQIHERIMGDDSFNGRITEVSEGKMLKKMKKQPLLFVELLFWKTRRECHYINVEYLLSELGHLKKESANWNNTLGDEEIGSSPAKFLILGLLGHNSGEQLMEDESQIALRRRKKLVLDGDLERQIKDLHEK